MDSTRLSSAFAAVLLLATASSLGACAAPPADDEELEAVATDTAPLASPRAAWDFFHRIDAERRARGLPSLEMAPGLVNIAQRWSGEMARSKNLRHNPRYGDQVSAEVTRSWQLVGENVGRGFDVAGLHAAFMNSPGHRDNVLGNWRYVGIGVEEEAGEIWVTVAFLRAGGVPTVPPACCFVVGAIEGKYRALGGPGGFLGAPITNELPTPDRYGRFNHFERGSIYWSPRSGVFEVHGAIREAWAQAGWEQGSLGYPRSDEYDVPGGRRSDFEGGSLVWNAATHVVTRVAR